jgi:hypothetical protein
MGQAFLQLQLYDSALRPTAPSRQQFVSLSRYSCVSPVEFMTALFEIGIEK